MKPKIKRVWLSAAVVAWLAEFEDDLWFANTWEEALEIVKMVQMRMVGR